MEKKMELLTVHSGEAEQPFEWSMGKYISKFMTELRDNKKLIGCRCPQCKKVYVPPREVCGDCFVPPDEIVELSGKGEIFCFTVLSFGFVDPDTGKQRPVPYTWAYIALDGADTCLPHFVEQTDLSVLRVGLRVEPVFEEERRGHLMDIRHFTAIKE